MMKIVKSCEKCLYDKQKLMAEKIEDETKRRAFLSEIRAALDHRKPEDCAPYLVYLFVQIQHRYGIGIGACPKAEYNEIMMKLEEKIEKRIEASDDPLATSMIFARIGNYIDFGAMNEVKPEVLYQLLEEYGTDGLNQEVYTEFLKDCATGKRFVLLCDNCGEIVLDKLMLRQLKKRFPQLELVAMVRGGEVLNDATMEDAVSCGLDQEVQVVSNGNAVAGTVLSLLSKEAREAIEQADVILSKGQGNYESFSDYEGVVYYTFLCKCDLFTQRFQVPRFTGMFIRAEQRKLSD